jgi:pilus assembly protein Flp/PilA
MLTYIQAWLSTKFDVDSERGATAVEYGMLVALIAALLVAIVGLFQDQVEALFQDALDALPG